MNTNNKENQEKVDDILIKCADCNDKLPPLKENTILYYNDNVKRICEKCREDYVFCYECSDTILVDDVWNYNHEFYCKSCFEDTAFVCEGCGNTLSNDDYDDDGRCQDCNRNNGDELSDDIFRDYSKKTIGARCQRNGTIIKTSRIFSAEIECNYPDVSTMTSLADTLHDSLGIVHDGSLGDNGIEFVTPKLKGKTGENYLKKVCAILSDNDYNVDKSCGLHIHVDCSDYKVSKIGNKRRLEFSKNMMMFYLIFEDVMLSMLPVSRRNNSYAYNLSNKVQIEDLQNLFTINDLEKMWYQDSDVSRIKRRKSEKYDSSRYHAINFHSLFSHDNIEIRHHAGTINDRKILEWANLHCVIVDRLADNTITKAELLSIFNQKLSLIEKTSIFFNLLNLKESSIEYFLSRINKFKSAMVLESDK